MNRGSLHWRAAAAIDARSFNEAPIHESGKSVERDLMQGTGDKLQ